MGATNDSGWNWTTGEAFSYSNFYYGEPNGSGDCLQMYADDYTWDDTTNDGSGNAGIKQHGFICEWEYTRYANPEDTSSKDKTPIDPTYNGIFIYNGGNNIITDYERKDKIDTGELAYEDFAIDGDDVIFNFGDDNSLTIQDGAGKLIDLNSNINAYTSDGVLDKRKKSITLLDTVVNFTADSKIMKIDGSETGAIEITGNKKKNYIVAGANGSTLNGGKGNDTLVGGAGADLFIYNKGDGKDIIEGFSTGDSISLDSDVTIKDAKTKGGGKILLSGVSSDTSININGVTKTVSNLIK